jgi:hypothetical protein
MQIDLPLLLHDMPNDAELRDKFGKGFALKIAKRCARNIWLRTRLAESQNWCCAWCHRRCVEYKGKPNSITIEHVAPRSKGGADEWENMVMACDSCNKKRGTHSVEYFLKNREFHSPESKKKRREKKKFKGYMKRLEKMFERGADLDEWLGTIHTHKEYMPKLVARKEELMA